MEYNINDLIFAARYPFTKKAKEMLTGKNVDISYSVMERAKRRVSNAIILENIPTIETNNREILNGELLSYPLSNPKLFVVLKKKLPTYQ